MFLLIPAVTCSPLAAAMPFRASVGRPVPRATHSAVKAIGRNSSSHLQHGHREHHADSRSSADLQSWPDRQRLCDKQTPETFRRRYLVFRRQRTPDSHGRQGAARDPREGLVSRPGHLTRVHLRLSGQLARRLHGADAQLLGRHAVLRPVRQAARRSRRRRGRIAGVEGRWQESYGANVSEILRNCFDR
jgi:hypothetical protein